MSDPTTANLAIVGIFALVFSAGYWIAAWKATRATEQAPEARKTQAVRVSLPNVDAPLYGLPDVRRRRPVPLSQSEYQELWEDEASR